MADDVVGVIDQNLAGSANTKSVDTSSLVASGGTLAGTTVERQRIVLGDPDNWWDRLSLASLRMERQAADLALTEAIEGSVNAQTSRAHESLVMFDRRGGSACRGAMR